MTKIVLEYATPKRLAISIRTFQGHTDAPLTEKGLKQLEKLKERCAGYPFDVIYTERFKARLPDGACSARGPGYSRHTR